MNDFVLYIMLSAIGAFAALGAVYKATPRDVWPPGLKQLGAGAWYFVAAILGALGVLAFTDSSNGSSDGGKDVSNGSDEGDSNPTDVESSDYERPPIEEPEEPDAPTPEDDPDSVDADYWSDAHGRGSSDG